MAEGYKSARELYIEEMNVLGPEATRADEIMQEGMAQGIKRVTEEIPKPTEAVITAIVRGMFLNAASLAHRFDVPKHAFLSLCDSTFELSREINRELDRKGDN